MEKVMSRELNPAVIENKINAELDRLSGYNIRTNLFNLILFYNREEETAIEDLLSSIFGKRPARIIHILNTKQNASSAYVKVRCYPDYEQNQICFQEIIIRNGLDNTGQSMGTWFPLCIHDIPIIIIWLCGLHPFPNLLQTVCGTVDKVIFCTEFNETLGEDPSAMVLHIFKKIILHKEHTSHPSLIVSDITWLKGLPLRQKTASLFDPVSMRSELYKLHTITVSGMSRSMALLYFLWLASRLHWNLIQQDNVTLHFHDRDHRIITVQSTNNSYKQIIFTTSEGKKIPLSWHSPPSSKTANRKNKQTTAYGCSIGSQDQLLQELDSLEPDPLYYNALKKLDHSEQALNE
jgi:glucose-6-phosphate dehydrogenase assembly protein OpcA